MKKQNIFFLKLNIKVLKPLCLGFVCCFFMSGMPVVQPADDCINEVYNIYKKMDIKELDKGFIHMSFSMVSQYRKTSQNDARLITSDFEYMVGKTKMIYQTSDMKVFTDEIDNFTIIPSRKTIFWTNSLMNAGKDKMTKGYKLLQDSMFTSCKMISCKMESNKEKPYDKIVAMEPLQKAKKMYPYDKIVFYINTTTNEIKKVVVNYPASSDFVQVDIIYKKVEYNYQNSILNMPAKDLIYSTNGSLQNEYKTFKIIDERLKSTKIE